VPELRPPPPVLDPELRQEQEVRPPPRPPIVHAGGDDLTRLRAAAWQDKEQLEAEVAKQKATIQMALLNRMMDAGSR
jgi:hypothetical protein